MQKDVTISWSKFDHGKGEVTTAAAKIAHTDFVCERGVLIKAATGNSGTVYIGNSDVTNADIGNTSGFELGSGESMFLEVNNVNKVYAIATADKQSVFWVAV